MADNGDSIKVALTVNGIVVTGKLVASIMSGSPALLTETAHSAIDCTTQLLLAAGDKHDKQSPGVAFKYGIAAGSVMLVSGGLFGIESGIQSLLSESSDSGWEWLSLVVLFGASLLELVSVSNAIRALNRTRNGQSWFRHVRNTRDTELKTIVYEDGADILGNVIAAIAIALTAVTGSHVFDAIGAILVGLLLTALSSELIGANVKQLRIA